FSTGVSPRPSRYTPTPRSTLRGSGSARNAAMRPRIGSGMTVSARQRPAAACARQRARTPRPGRSRRPMPPHGRPPAPDREPPGTPATAQELPQVVVSANAPLAGLGLPANEIPANVQTADSRQMQRQQSLDLADYLNAGFSGVSASGSAANPFQMDVNYHGFTASPLLGTPEGLSVYVDGVRVNESFGDTVNWDLIPQSAISTVTLMSGSNPVFGLNTLGGALLLRTKSVHDNHGTGFEAT